MIDDDRAAIAAAQDFSTGIAMWRAANARPDCSNAPRFARHGMMPLAMATLLAVVNCLLLGFALLPASASL